MNTGALFVTGAGTGVLAGATSCAVVQVGLLASAVRGAGCSVRPVAGFLAGKLVVHTVLGALLGLVGGVLRPGPQARGLMLAVAGVALALFALDLLGLRLLPRRSRCERDEPSRGTPVLLGAATVFVPCALTLTAEFLAVTSRSPLGGAVVMAGFVLGTAPVFGVVGMTVGRALTRGRLTSLVGVALVAVAAWTLMSGLRLGGWLPGGDAGTAAADARFVRTEPDGTQVVTLWALDEGYRPALLTARAGVRTVLEVRTENTRGHTRAFSVPGRGLDAVLPATGATRLDLGTPGKGRMRFLCASGHFPGAITFR
ncbi:urease accessory protein UreH domain-containing protein [Spirillospora sp. CA-294931]|uniref:urease accessory protein UreH domain-containing protein n=1 Tax=Spirillospora sp. CA-294931 TaxID=3240042 RepID=UPI003D94F3F8